MLEAAMAKLHVSECFVQSSLDAVQIFGGYGYMTEQQVERDLRDAVGSTLYSGTSEIQRNIIAKGAGARSAGASVVDDDDVKETRSGSSS